MTHANVALVFVVLVVLAAAFGGRWVGATAAIVSTLSFDFFFTRPYQSLSISKGDDVETTLLLLAVGLIVGEIVVRADRARRARDRGRDEIARPAPRRRGRRPGRARRRWCSRRSRPSCARCSRCALRVRARRRIRGPLPVLERSGIGRDDGAPLRRRGVRRCPAEGLAIPVLARGVEVGRLAMTPDPAAGVSLEERIVAIALADQLGAAHRRRRQPHQQRSERMKDVVLVLALIAFFGVCVLYVRACERIMGPDDEVDAGDATSPPTPRPSS